MCQPFVLQIKSDDELGYVNYLLKRELYTQMDVYTVTFHFLCFFFAFLCIPFMLLR
jgi:hypothetical protein